MNLTTWLIYLAVGRLMTWFLQINGLMRPLWDLHPLMTQMKECDLCLGFWVYLLLSLFLVPAFGIWPWGVEIVILAALTSFIAHLLRIGWQTRFGVTVID